MISEIGRSESTEVTETKIEKFNDAKAKSEMTFKEAENFWKSEFHEQSEQAKAESLKNLEMSSENNKQDVQKHEVSELAQDYIEDLRAKSECSDTIPADAIEPAKLELQPPEKVADKREEFDYNKAKLRKEWEELNQREWPKYEEDVLNDDGTVIRKAGDNYDAHHIQPLQLGGENVASNITPLDMNSHKEIHSSTGSCRALVNSVKGGN